MSEAIAYPVLVDHVNDDGNLALELAVVDEHDPAELDVACEDPAIRTACVVIRLC